MLNTSEATSSPAPALIHESSQTWQLQPSPIKTQWADGVDPGNVWCEYPRPQMVREGWQNLNGLWEYAITSDDVAAPETYDGYILVPYPVESALSGVKRSLRPDQLLWYRRTADHAGLHNGDRLLMHCEAVDYDATVYVNGREIGSHRGGYQRFTLDISDAIRPGPNEFVIKVQDPTELGPNARGKQRQRGRWMFYTASSGIWQTVWLERVPNTYIAGLKTTPDVDNDSLHLQIGLHGDTGACAVNVIARSGDRVVAQQTGHNRMTLRLEKPQLWSPDDPHLYDLQVQLLQQGRVVDEVKSYFGLRKIEVKPDNAGRLRIHLNNHYTFNLGVVDQGFWPDGLYTAPSDAALEFDVRMIKALGFNTVRKHIKIEAERWYYHCDRVGLMVWQDMPSASNDTPQARRRFEQEIQENLAQLHNHPSITTWVLFNEGWGAYHPERLTNVIKRADPSRLVNGHSGPYDQVNDSRWLRNRDTWRLLHPLGGPAQTVDDLQQSQYSAPPHWMPGDLIDIHIYPGPEMFAARPGAALVTGEHGSFGVYVPNHIWDELSQVGLGLGGTGLTPQQMLAAYEKSTEKLKELEAQGLSGALYFQIADVEKEQQGFFTYDRAIAKVPISEIARLNAKLIAPASDYDFSAEARCVETFDWFPESQRYADLLEQFRNGQRELSLLLQLAVLAQRQGDLSRSNELADEFIAHAPHPYTESVWKCIVALTQSSQSRGFQLLLRHADEVNTLLEAQVAQRKVLEIIRGELIVPYFNSKAREIGWDEFEHAVAEKHGELGREAVVGARMMDELLRENWAGFGSSFVRYFETATSRSCYAVHSLCYRIAVHVADKSALETAVRVMEWQISSEREYPVVGRYDPIELDTYAALLHKLGRMQAALSWQELAVAQCDGRAQDVIENLNRIRAALTKHDSSIVSRRPAAGSSGAR